MRKLIGFLALALAILQSCSTYNDEQITGFDKEIRDYIEKNNIECTKSTSGLYFRIDEPGEGELIKYTNIVSFTYKGRFLDGTELDEQSEPIEFQVRELIAAWQEIMLQLRKGGKAFLIAPPQLAYGDHELDDIPSNSVLVYDIEVVDVK